MEKIQVVLCRGHVAGRCRVIGGTHYHIDTPDELCYKLEELRNSRIRCRFILGSEGKEWQGQSDCGRVGRSTGSCKVPLTIFNKRSTGGGELLTHCIVRIVTAMGGTEIYRKKD